MNNKSCENALRLCSVGPFWLKLFLFQAPCGLGDWLSNGMPRLWRVLKGPCGLKAGLEHGGDRALRCPHGRSLGSWYKSLNTALDVDPPETPILVISTPISITFSFEGLGDSRILSFELQLKGVDNRTTLDGGDTGVRLSDRVQFVAQSTSPAVRVTLEGRWIVTAGSLQVDFCYSLQLRGLAGGGVTAWSEVSEGMSTESTTTYRGRKSTYSGEGMLRRDPGENAKEREDENVWHRECGRIVEEARADSAVHFVSRCARRKVAHDAHSVLR